MSSKPTFMYSRNSAFQAFERRRIRESNLVPATREGLTPVERYDETSCTPRKYSDEKRNMLLIVSKQNAYATCHKCAKKCPKRD